MINNPKYRYLTSKELLELEPHFINFLASEGITADKWQEYQRNKDPQIDRYLAAFSDLILESVYSSCNLVETVSPNTWLFYFFDDQKILMKGLILEGEDDLDLRKLTKEDLLNWNESNREGSLKMVQAEKTMKKSKSLEVHHLLEKGGFISKNRSMYDALTQLLE